MDTTELIMLGTGNAMVTRCFNTCFALRTGKEVFLTDAGGGNGILTQLEKADISFGEIHHMFLTHGHTDHVLGAVWVVRKIAALMEEGAYEGCFHIYGHDEVLGMLHTFCRMTLIHKFYRHIGEQIFLDEVKDGEKQYLLDMELTSFDIFSGKTRQFGYSLQLPCQKRLTCLGDEPYNEKCAPYVAGTDWLMSEAFCLYDDREIFRPYEKFHSTALDAGQLAEALGVSNLILYHTEDRTLDTRKERYTREAKRVFSGTVYVPDDLERIWIG